VLWDTVLVDPVLTLERAKQCVIAANGDLRCPSIRVAQFHWAYTELRIGDQVIAANLAQSLSAAAAAYQDQRAGWLCDVFRMAAARRAGRFADAEHIASELVTLPESARPLHDQFFTLAISTHAAASLGRLDVALPRYYQAVKLARQLNHKSHLAVALGNLGAFLIDMLSLDEAITTLSEALQIAEDLHSSNVAEPVATNLGIVYWQCGKADDVRRILATPTVEQIMRNPTSVYGPDIALLLVASERESDGTALLARYRAKDAIDAVDAKWVTPQIAAIQNNWPQVVTTAAALIDEVAVGGAKLRPMELLATYRVLADAYERLGNTASALEILKRASELRERLVSQSLRAQRAVVAAEEELRRVREEKNRQALLASVAARERAMLQDLNAVLEKRVDERTSALEAAKDAAERALQSQKRFVARMSHELRTPLNGILGLTELLQREFHATSHSRMLAGIEASGRNLIKKLDQILSFAALERQIEQPRETCVALDPWLRGVLAPWCELASHQGRRFDIKVDSRLPVELALEPRLLSEAIGQLVDNALKHVPSGSVTVRAAIAAETDHWMLMVEDEGRCISPEQLHQLFQPFSQADGHGTNYTEGLGLGLSLVQSIADGVGGSVRAHLSSEGGLCVALILPLITRVAQRAVESTSTQPEPRQLRVLLVEDNAINRLVAQAMLEREGHVVTIANDGYEGVEQAALRQCDVILMDWRMPRMDGLTATREIRLAESRLGLPAVPIIGVTANSLESDQAACLAAGMNSFLTKPLSARALQEALDAVCHLATNQPD
jgi:signal transduction histidine kinase/CheY-like chemotaxis protein